MVDITLPTKVEKAPATRVYFANNVAAPVLWPAFDATIDNTHPTVASSATYRPIDLKMPFPSNDLERWTYDTSQQMTVTVGSQVGTAVLGQRYGTEYAYLHIRGITVPANGHLTGVTVTRASAPSTPRYASSSDGFSQFTGSNAIWLHVGLMTGGESTVPIPDGAWAQEEDGPGRHKWEAWVFDTTTGFHWVVRAYTWPGLSRVELTVAAVWHDERDPVAYSTSMEWLRVSFPGTTHDVRCMWSTSRGMPVGAATVNSQLRRYIQLCGQTFLGDGQAVRARMVAMPLSAAAAEFSDFDASSLWPVKACCDPEFWKKRIGPFRYYEGHDGFWPVGPVWGDGGATCRTHVWSDVDPRRGFLAHHAMLVQEGADFSRWPRDRRVSGLNSNYSGGNPAMGHNTLSLLLGIRNGNPRSLCDLEHDVLWESCMRPTNFPRWENGAPLARWTKLGDIPLGDVVGGTFLLEQRINYQAMKNSDGYQSFGKQYKEPPNFRRWYHDFDSLGTVSGYKATHQDVTQVAALALLNDIDDHETDFLQIQAALYPFNDRNYDDEDPNVSTVGEFRTGRTEKTSAWAFETLDATQRAWLLDFWQKRFAYTDIPGVCYWEMWNHLAKKHEWRAFTTSFHDSDLLRPLLNLYWASWEPTMGFPGYSLVARMLRHFLRDGAATVIVSELARFWLSEMWREIDGDWQPIKFVTQPGLRLPNQLDANSRPFLDASLYGQKPPEAWYDDDTKRVVDTSTEIWWYMGAVQDARRLVLSEFSDTVLAAKADEILASIVKRFPTINDIDSRKIRTSLLAPEQWSTDTIPLLTSNTIRMATLVEKAPATGFSIDQGGIGITMPTLVEKAPLIGGYHVTIDTAPTDEIVINAATRVEKAPLIGGRATVGDAINVWGRLLVEKAPLIGGRASTPVTITMPTLVEKAPATGFSVVGGSRTPSVTRHRGKWVGTQRVRGRWGNAMTDQGITITAGDSERIQVDVYDGATQLDVSLASNAVFVLSVPATHYKAEQELLRRTLIDGGIDVSTGSVIVELGDTSALEDGLAIWSLRLTLGGQAQTVVRAPVRILADPVPAEEEAGNEYAVPVY